LVKLLYINFLLLINIFAAQDYVYDFLDSEGDQLNLEEQRVFQTQYDGLKIIKENIILGDYKKAKDSALKLIQQTKNKLIKSKTFLLYYTAVFEEQKIITIIKEERKFKKNIENSSILEPDLHAAYLLYTDYLIRLRKFKDATKYASKVMNTYNKPEQKEYGMIYISKIYLAQNKIRFAQNVLNKVLRYTENIEIASLATGIQFDILIKNEEFEKAKDMIRNIVKYNIEFFANNPTLANQKIETLALHEMHDLVIHLAKILLKKNKNKKIIPSYLFKLADAQIVTMQFEEAKKNLKKIIHDYRESDYAIKAKEAMDEILLREGQIKPESLIERYRDSESMQQKILLKELQNQIDAKEYNAALKLEKIYKKIFPNILKRFSMPPMEDIMKNIRALVAKKYLLDNKCSKTITFLKDNEGVFDVLVKQNNMEEKLLTCLSKNDYTHGFNYLNDKFKLSKDPYTIYLLEKSAIQIKAYKDAMKLSKKIQSFGTKKLRKKEIIDRFIIMNNLKEAVVKDNFFNYIDNQKWLIENNKDPIMVDVLYQYYQFLEKYKYKGSFKILNDLYKMQNESNIFVYSPFVDIEIATYYYENKQYKKALKILESAKVKKTTKKKKVHRFYYLKAKVYNKLNRKIEYIQSIYECVNIDGDSMWKQLCKKVEEMNDR
jgi:hypothetical protein